MKICTYCGLNATVKDHILPASYLTYKKRAGKKADKRLSKVQNINNIVSSCAECNNFAADKVFNSLEEKRSYIQTKIRQRYSSILNLPDWERSDLTELGNELKKEIIIKMIMKRIIENRLLYPFSKYTEDDIRLEKRRLNAFLKRQTTL